MLKFAFISLLFSQILFSSSHIIYTQKLCNTYDYGSYYYFDKAERFKKDFNKSFYFINKSLKYSNIFKDNCQYIVDNETFETAAFFHKKIILFKSMLLSQDNLKKTFLQ